MYISWRWKIPLFIWLAPFIFLHFIILSRPLVQDSFGSVILFFIFFSCSVLLSTLNSNVLHHNLKLINIYIFFNAPSVFPMFILLCLWSASSNLAWFSIIQWHEPTGAHFNDAGELFLRTLIVCNIYDDLVDEINFVLAYFPNFHYENVLEHPQIKHEFLETMNTAHLQCVFILARICIFFFLFETNAVFSRFLFHGLQK